MEATAAEPARNLELTWTDPKRYLWLLGLIVPLVPFIAWGLVELTWLAQSTGWAEFRAFKASQTWTLSQGRAGKVGEIGCDPDERNPARLLAVIQLWATDPDPRTRLIVIDTLTRAWVKSVPNEAHALLTTLAADPDKAVARKAATAIKKLPG